MTRRERMEARLDKREEWAASRQRKAAALLALNAPYRGDHAFNTQPGHIPERARAIRRSEKAFEHTNVAAHHGAVAATLAENLERNIFSDDADAIEQLEARIAEREAERDRKKLANATWRKAGKPAPDAGADAWRPVVEKVGEETALLAARGLVSQGRTDGGKWAPYSWAKPFDLTSLGANIRSDRERIEEVKRQQQRAAAAADAGGVAIVRHESANWCTVTFAERPERVVIEALRAADYGWSGGSWNGYLDKLPAFVAAMQPE